jgi:hypothetical protein
MIDYIKINNLTNGSTIRDLLDFEIKVNEKTGEEFTNRNKTAKLKNLLFIDTPNGYMKMKGSIHKFANNGEFNNDRLTLIRFREVSEKLSQFISSEDYINSIEFGVNILTPFNPSDFINNLLASGKKHIKKDIRPGCCFAEAQYNQYIIKIYNKGLQQPTGENILRLELKYTKMENLFKNGLKWVELSNPETWLYLANELKKKISNLVYYDPAIKLNEIPEPHQTIIKTGHNPIYWENLKDLHASRNRGKFKDLITKYGNTFNDLKRLIDEEISLLVNSDHFLNTAKNTHLVNSDLSLYSQNSPMSICKVTGINISCQKPGSEFLCISGIRKLFKTDQEEYNKLKSEWLSAKKENESPDVQFYYIAHNIRNEYHNPKNNTRRSIKRITQDPLLFEVLHLIREEKRLLAGL